jgi:prophage regulatory protein
MGAMLKRRDVVALTGLSYTTIWRMEPKGEFPARRKLSAGRVGWIREEVVAWLQSREKVTGLPETHR